MTTYHQELVRKILGYVRKNEGCYRETMLKELNITSSQETWSGLVKNKILKSIRHDGRKGRMYFYDTYVEPMPGARIRTDGGRSYMKAYRDKKRKEAEDKRMQNQLLSPLRLTPLVLSIPKYDGEIKTRWVFNGVAS